MFHADLHIHSKYSRACSKDCDIPHLAWWAARKGITVIGTGDFTHPAWAEELKESLVSAEPGLFRLRPDLEGRLGRETPASCTRPVRFMLSVEISTIYRRDDRTRKVHHLLYAPDFDAAGRITKELSKIGNLASDGRPILGLDSRDLLEITLNAGPGCYLVPAHVWTPWFAALGSRSGFDSMQDCYADLAGHVFAIETGLSSDPPMNWMCSGLDSYRLVSNSDAHSPPMLGREATTFSTDLDYFAMADALRTGNGLAGTLEFYPEEGKYHLDGHRKCGVRLDPEQTRAYGGQCPKCEKPLTVGVLHRVSRLADRPAGYRPPGAAASTNMLRLPQILGELRSVGPQSKRVAAETDRLVAALGPELDILTAVPLDEITRTGGGLLGEAIARLRRGDVIREAGFDGEYGTIRLMRPGELQSTATLFDVAGPDARQRRDDYPERLTPDGSAPVSPTGQREAPPRAGPAALDATTLLGGLDPEQRAAATAAGPLLIVAGPGTGKTRTLTHRLACQIARGDVRPAQCLALTFTRRAADEMRLRLAALLGPRSGQITVTTFHGLGLQILRENPGAAGLDPAFRVADEAAVLAVATELAGSPAAARRLLARTSRTPKANPDDPSATPPDASRTGDPHDGHPVTGGPPVESAQAGAAHEEETQASATQAGDRQAGISSAGTARARVAGGKRARKAGGRRAGNAGDPEARAALTTALAARGLIEVEALVEASTALLRGDPDLAAALRERWPCVSVDEYQDVDERQYELLRLLTAAPGAGPDRDAPSGVAGREAGAVTGRTVAGPEAGRETRTVAGRGLTVIGDPDQAIYSFRGSDVGFFLRFAADFPAATTVRLSTNYRSAPGIVAAAMQAIAPGTLVPDRTLRAGRPAPAAAPAGPTLIVHEAADERAEADWIAASVDRLLGGASFHSLDSGRADGHGHGGLGLADIAVLYRTDAQAGPLMQALTRAGLPFQKRSHDRLARRAGVTEIVGEMRLVVPGAGDRDGAAGAPRIPVVDIMRAAVRRLAGSAPAAVAADIRAAGEVLAPLAGRCGRDMQAFLTEIAVGAEADALDPRAEAVPLLTLHAAKGLEFEVVFLAGCERGLLPLWLPGTDPDTAPDEAEERRLLFVGMTRARSRLMLSCATARTRLGPARQTGPSPFLAAIDPRLLARTGQPAARPRPARQLRLL